MGARFHSCYATSAWRGGDFGSGHFYGTGECFLFRWEASEQAIVKSIWTRQEELFQLASSDALAMGGGSGGGKNSGGGCYGLWGDQNLEHGSSGRCATFDNPVLCRDANSAEEETATWQRAGQGQQHREEQEQGQELHQHQRWAAEAMFRCVAVEVWSVGVA